MSDRQKIFLCTPLYDGRIEVDASIRWCNQASRNHDVMSRPGAGSFLTLNMNLMWTAALNLRAQGVTWFAMLHGDIVPAEWWLDTLVEIALTRGADFVSAVVPLKDGSGRTSCGIADLQNDWNPYTRITQRQLWHPNFPETFNRDEAVDALKNLPVFLRVSVPEERLGPMLANTGASVCRLDGRFDPEKVHFRTHDRIIRVNGTWGAQAQSEDWVFTRQLQELGASVNCTRKIACIHRGAANFNSSETWGEAIDSQTQGLRDVRPDQDANRSEPPASE